MRVPSDFSATEGATAPDSVQRFCAHTTPYLPEAHTDAEFIAAMRDLTRWHQQRSPWYRALLAQQGVQVDALATLDDLVALPPVHANFFKQHEVLSVPEDAVALHLTSSGTTGQKSQMFFDAFTIGNARRMVDDVMQARGVASSTPANYLVNAYEPYEGLRVFDAFGALAALQDYAQDGVPARIIGFPAFLHFALQRMQRLGMAPLRLPEGSCVIFGGGWKGHADQAIAKDALHASITHWLGIAPERIVETFGAVEHSIPYVGCSQHHLHAPMWSRVLVRDVRTLAPVPDGQPGFLSFLSPYITSVPAHSVVMGDLAVRHPAGSCGCGCPTPWFEVLGRAGTSSNKSCAAAAADLLPSA